MKPFKDLKVVELASVLAGPAVGLFFAELGAEVIKIENKMTGGDLTRKWKLPCENPADSFSSYYHAVNWGKKIRFYDLNDDLDRKETERLIGDADILLLNFKKGDAQKFGFQSSELLQRYTSLIIAEILGFEDHERVAYDAVLQAETGFMSVNGEPDRDPLKLPVAFIDLMAAHQLKEGILIALMNRMKTGKGALVTASLYKSAVASLANQASTYLNTGFVPGSIGSLHPTIAPYGEMILCSDNRLVLLAVGTDEQFRRLVELLGHPEIAEDPSFATNERRVMHRSRLGEVLGEYLISWSSTTFLAACHKALVPAAALLPINEVFENKVAQSMILSQKEPDGNVSKRVSTVAFNIYYDRTKI